jgi:hypothetical protein
VSAAAELRRGVALTCVKRQRHPLRRRRSCTRPTCPCLALLAGDGKCPICDSYVRPATLVRVCDECNYGSYAGRCVICGGIGVSDAYYCKECTIQEKDVSARDWLGSLFACFVDCYCSVVSHISGCRECVAGASSTLPFVLLLLCCCSETAAPRLST